MPARLMVALALAVAPWAAAACTFDEDRNPSLGCEGCPEDSCHLGFCFVSQEDRGPSTGAGRGGTGAAGEGDGEGRDGGEPRAGSDGAGQGGESGTGEAGSGVAGSGADAGPDGEVPCIEGDFCYEGPSGTRTVGRCRAGAKSCAGRTLVACLGQITPVDETCNGLDDDCDEAIDEELTLGSCDTGAQGVCAAGTMRCEQGRSLCESMTAAAGEICNALDDDCDGTTDEASTVACFPEGVAGCEPDGEDGFTCVGLCRSGESACVGGELQACSGQIEPAAADACEGMDEDCDGEVDEGCDCRNDSTQPCYGGPTDTAGVGTCRRGTQTCVNGAFGACSGAITPVTETCGNEGADNDCDAVADDIPERGDPCTVEANQGVCRSGTRQCLEGALTCVTPQPPPDADTAPETVCDGSDQDCDGVADDGFDLQTDPRNCGRCGRSCGANERCCGGGCVVLATDPLHCGECGNDCGDGMTCCAGGCVDLQTTDAHCGACGNDCAALGQTLGRACTCAMGACTSPEGPCAM
jgi:hypothetical protein